MRILPVLFAVALFSTAFLSFSVQPILGKMLLPMVGGAPAGWIVAMAFFQLALLAGYGLSWLLERFSPRVHAVALLMLYAWGAYFVPPALSEIPGQLTGPALSFAIVQSLLLSIFVPYVALTATTSALQRVFAATTDPTARDPYYLFVASNAGSFVGLFLYPLVLEPFYGLHAQSILWQGVYAAAIGLIVIAMFVAWHMRGLRTSGQGSVTKTKVTAYDVSRWLLLSFVPCSLSMGVTTNITTDIAGLPLFWVLPLGLYLLTFILAFSSKTKLSMERVQFWHLVSVAFVVMSMGRGMGYQPSGSTTMFLFLGFVLLAAFFITAYSLHRSLAEMRPAADRLGLFYFIIAAGGGLAGVLHAFILPYVLNGIIEFHLVMILSLLLHPQFRRPLILDKKRARFFHAAFIVALFASIASAALQRYGYSYAIRMPFIAMLIICGVFVSMRPRLLTVLGIVVLATVQLSDLVGHVQIKGRNFFGAYAVRDVDSGSKTVRYFTHGNTIHGMTIYGGTPDEKHHNSYYTNNNPIHEVLRSVNAKTIAVIGLGVGQMACYDSSAKVDFFEIDPDVEKIASQFFPYLKDCPAQNIFIGDGRLMLQQKGKRYDVLMIDAFTSDSLPLHLLTREALEIYKRHVKNDGVILFHISNRFFDLAQALAAIAHVKGMTAYHKFHNMDSLSFIYPPSHWLAIPVSDNMGSRLLDKGWQIAEPAGAPWSDDYSSLLSALKWFEFKL